MVCLESFLSLQCLSEFLGHPLTISVIIFLFGRILINDLVPGSKEKLIKKVVEMKNRIKEAELIYNRIVITSQDLKKSKDRNEDTRDREKIFNESLTEELSRISNLANEVIPLISI